MELTVKKESDDETASFDLLLLKEKAEIKADEIIMSIDRTINSLDVDSVVESIRIILKREGNNVD